MSLCGQCPPPRPPRAPRGPCEKKNSSAEQLKTFANGFEIPLVLRTLATSCQCHPFNANCLFINIKISYLSAYGAVPTLRPQANGVGVTQRRNSLPVPQMHLPGNTHQHRPF